MTAPAPRKRYEPDRAATPAPVHEFEVVFVRAGVEEVHEFTARPRATYAELLGVLHNASDTARQPYTLPYMDRMLRKALLDDDGVPARWRPQVRDGGFTAPNGDWLDHDQLPQYTAFEAGSSRRRWVQLMDDDDDELEIELPQIVRIFEDMMAVIGRRPTSR